jgi:hypothetical protein
MAATTAIAMAELMARWMPKALESGHGGVKDKRNGRNEKGRESPLALRASGAAELLGLAAVRREELVLGGTASVPHFHEAIESPAAATTDAAESFIAVR